MKRAIVFVSAFAAALAISASAFASSECMQGAAASRPFMASQREVADKLFYGRLGQGAGLAGGLHGGPEIGLGMRLELNRIGLDASMSFGVTQMTKSMEITGLRGSWLKLTAQYFVAPEADATPYLGMGLSWGGQKEKVLGETYTGSGLSSEIVLGYEFLRSSTIRLFLQADATLPLYRAMRAETPQRIAHGKAAIASPELRYLPTIGLSLGVAWGKPRVIIDAAR